MKIALVALGSQGDVQPYLALAVRLKHAGHQVRLLSSETFAASAHAHGIEFWPLPGDVQAVMATPEMRALLDKGNFLAINAHTSKYAKEAAVGWAEQGEQAARGMDLLIAGFGGMFLALALAEKLNLPLMQAHVFPFTPTRAFPAPLFPPSLSRLGGGFNRLSYSLARQAIWLGSRGSDAVVRRVLGLPELRSSPHRSERLHQLPVLYGFSPSVLPKPSDWTHTEVTGYWFLDPEPNWTPDPALSAFLEAGPKPVYVGFGSMGSRDPEGTARLILDALEQSGQRAILHAGWSGMQAEHMPESVHQVGNVPHTWLFPRMAAIVHHGGAGTTAAGLRAGVPNLVVPFFGDQPFWGARVASLGVGPAPIARKQLTAENLAGALERMVSDQTLRSKAATLGAKIQAEDGLAKAVEIIGGLERHPRHPSPLPSPLEGVP